MEGQEGFLLTSTVPGFEDKSLFLPDVRYWTSELCTESSKCAKTFAYWAAVETTVIYKLLVKDITLGYEYWGRETDEYVLFRYHDNRVRPVRDK